MCGGGIVMMVGVQRYDRRRGKDRRKATAGSNALRILDDILSTALKYINKKLTSWVVKHGGNY